MIPSTANPDSCRLARDLLAEGRQVRLKANGDSMRPCIRDGDIITLGPAKAARLKRGHVIAFENAAGTLTIHRLAAIRAEAAGLVFVTHGDANGKSDPPFGANRVAGRVLEVRRNNHRVRVNSPVCGWLAACRRMALAVRRRAQLRGARFLGRSSRTLDLTTMPPRLPWLPPEARLLLLAAEPCPDARTAPRLGQAIGEGLHWDRFNTTAHAHGVHPLAARTLLASVASCIPAGEQQVLRAWLHRTLGRNLQLVQSLGEILELFQAAAIPVVCLKGPGLAVSAYGGLEARACNDLDLMVPPGQSASAAAALLAAGFARTLGHLTPAERAFFQPEAGHHQIFLRQRDHLMIELHSSLGHEDLGQASVGAPFWSRCDNLWVEGVSLPVLSPLETVLFQARHAAAHGWNVLRHLCDFQAVARRLSPNDWERVAAEARRTRQTTSLGVTTLLVQEYFGAAMPVPVAPLIGTSRRIQWLARQASRGLHANLRLGTCHAPSFALPCLRQPGIMPWLRGFHDLIRPSLRERDWVRLPRPLWPLYYLLKPVRVAVKYGRRGFHLLGAPAACRRWSRIPK